MITYEALARRGYRLFKNAEDRKEIRQLFLKSFKEDHPKVFAKYLLRLYKILFSPEKIFFDGIISHRNEELERQIQKEFIDFFLREHIDLFLSLYPKLKEENQGMLDVYLPILIKFLPEAKPEPKYFTALYLIMADALILSEKVEDQFLKNRLEKLTVKGFARYRIRTEIFENVIDNDHINQIRKLFDTVEYYSSFMLYYLDILKDFQQTLKVGRFNNQQALFLIFSSLIYENEIYRDLLEEIGKKLELEPLDRWKKELKFDVNTDTLKTNIRSILNI